MIAVYCKVVDHFDMPRDIVAVAMDLLDRAIVLQGADDGISTGRFQCLAMTCFFLALKIRKQRILSLEDLVILGRGRHLKEEILDAEIGIIVALQGRLEAPAGRDFLALYEKYWRGRNATFVARFFQDSIIPTAEYLVELSVLDAYFELKRPSIVALAAAQVAVEEEQQMYHGRPWCGLPAYSMVSLSAPPFTGTTDAQELNDIKSRLRALKANGEMPRASRL